MNDDLVKTILASLTEEQKRAIIADLLKTSTQVQTKTEPKPEEAFSSKPRSVVNEDFTITKEEKGNRKSAVRFHKNEWEDIGEFAEVKTPERKITPRNRKPPNKVTLECHVCGREFQQNASMVYGEYHRCNHCTGR